MMSYEVCMLVITFIVGLAVIDKIDNKKLRRH